MMSVFYDYVGRMCVRYHFDQAPNALDLVLSYNCDNRKAKQLFFKEYQYWDELLEQYKDRSHHEQIRLFEFLMVERFENGVEDPAPIKTPEVKALLYEAIENMNDGYQDFNLGMWTFCYTDSNALDLVEYISNNPNCSTDDVHIHQFRLHYRLQMRLFEEYGGMYEYVKDYAEACKNDEVITDATYMPPYTGPKSYYWIHFANYYYAELRSWPPVLLTADAPKNIRESYELFWRLNSGD